MYFLGDDQAPTSDSVKAAASELYPLFQRTQTLYNQLYALRQRGLVADSLWDRNRTLINALDQFYGQLNVALPSAEDLEIRTFLAKFGFPYSTDSTLGFLPLIPIILILAGTAITVFVSKFLIQSFADYKAELARQEKEAVYLNSMKSDVEAGKLSANDAGTLAKAHSDALPTGGGQTTSWLSSLGSGLTMVLVAGAGLWLFMKLRSKK